MVVDTTIASLQEATVPTGPRITAHHLIPMTGSHPRHWRFRRVIYLLFHDKRPVKSTPSQAALGSPQVRDPRSPDVQVSPTSSSHLHRHRPTTPLSHKPSRNSPPSSSNPHRAQDLLARPNPSSTRRQNTNPPSPRRSLRSAEEGRHIRRGSGPEFGLTPVGSCVWSSDDTYEK
jgi:hypothetical protein